MDRGFHLKCLLSGYSKLYYHKSYPRHSICAMLLESPKVHAQVSVQYGT